MKIGIFTDSYKPLISGVVVSCDSLREGLEALGHEVYIITTNCPKVKQEKDSRVIRIKGMPLPFKIFKDYRLVLSYKKHLFKIKALNLDVIHVHTEFGVGSLGLLAKQKLNLPLVYTTHTMYVAFFDTQKSFIFKCFKKPILKYVDYLFTKFIFNSDVNILPTKKVLYFLENRYSNKVNDTSKINYQIVPTGFNLEKFYCHNHSPEKVFSLKQQLGLKDSFVCLYVGRISAEKEIDYLMDAFTSFHLQNPKSKFLIIGDGPERKNLEKKAKKLNLDDKIIFLGFVAYDKLGIYYQLGNVFINASLFETQGLTYIEALAASLPCVVRFDQALEGVIKHEQNGFFYHNQEQLITILTSLYQNPDNFKQLSYQAQKSVNLYTQKTFVTNVLEVYNQAIDNHKLKKQKLIQHQKETSDKI
ncbi:glycosyltransferase [Candidatus Phytoplasma asteris]|uniref:glycosyltransferase n=1 Tax=Candidatus Phytoplasma asteris TaxID=85620 RepID=UPI0039E1A79C